MPVTKEFTVLMENRPSMLGKICQALADKEVNILALESFPTRGRFVTRFIVDNPDTAKTVLNNEKLTYADAVRASIASGLLNTAPFLNQSFNEVDTVRSRHVHIRNYQVCAGGSGWTKAFLNHVEGTQARFRECDNLVSPAVVLEESRPHVLHILGYIRLLHNLGYGGPMPALLFGCLTDILSGHKLLFDSFSLGNGAELAPVRERLFLGTSWFLGAVMEMAGEHRTTSVRFRFAGL